MFLNLFPCRKILLPPLRTLFLHTEGSPVSWDVVASKHPVLSFICSTRTSIADLRLFSLTSHLCSSLIAWFWSTICLASDKRQMNSLWAFHALPWVFSLTLGKWMQVYIEIPFLSISGFRSLKNLSGKCKFYEYHSWKASVPVGALRFEVLGSKENTESSLSTKY